MPRVLKMAVTSIQLDELAKREGQALKAIERKIKDRFTLPKRALDAAKKSILDLERDMLAPLLRGLSHISSQCIAWSNKQAVEAEKERLKQQAELEAKARVAAEADARAAEQAQEPALAKEIREEPIVVPLPEVKPAVAKVAGATIPVTWEAEVIGYPDDTAKFLELVTHCATNPKFVNLLNPNMVALNQMARSQKQGFSIPGCRAVKKQGMRFK